MLRKLEYIKDGDTRKSIVNHLKNMWEADVMKTGMEYGEDYYNYSSIVKNSKKEIEIF